MNDIKFNKYNMSQYRCIYGGYMNVDNNNNVTEFGSAAASASCPSSEALA